MISLPLTFPFLSYFSDFLFKLLLIGDSGVGKSCLLLRFAVRMNKCGHNLHQLSNGTTANCIDISYSYSDSYHQIWLHAK